jgi:hypothetical protein
MRLAYALLADSAQFTREGKLFLLGGGLDIYNVPSLPATLASICTVVSIFLSRDSLRDEYPIQIILTDPSGNIPVGWSFSIDTIEDSHMPDVPPRLNFAATLTGASFSSQGTYMFRVIVEGEVMANLPFYIHHQAPDENVADNA